MYVGVMVFAVELMLRCVIDSRQFPRTRLNPSLKFNTI
jgi:hypothetical protein